MEWGQPRTRETLIPRRGPVSQSGERLRKLRGAKSRSWAANEEQTGGQLRGEAQDSLRASSPSQLSTGHYYHLCVLMYRTVGDCMTGPQPTFQST